MTIDICSLLFMVEGLLGPVFPRATPGSKTCRSILAGKDEDKGTDWTRTNPEDPNGGISRYLIDLNSQDGERRSRNSG